MIRKNNDQPLKDILMQLYQSKKLRPKLDQEKAKTIWSEMMGDMIMKHTKEVRMSRGKVYITLDSAPLKQELSFGKAKIIRKFNKAFEERGTVIEDVVFM